MTYGAVSALSIMDERGADNYMYPHTHMGIGVRKMQTQEIDYEGLREHVKETIMQAFDEGVKTGRVVGVGWGSVAFQAHITERALQQKFVPAEAYARIAMTVFREAFDEMRQEA